MSWHKTGKVDLENGSQMVVGAQTDWLQHVSPGFAFVGPDGAQYEVESVISAGSMTLATPYNGPSVVAGQYAIVQTQSMIAQLAQQSGALLATFAGSRDTAVAAAAAASASALVVGDAAAIPAAKIAAEMAAETAIASATAAAISADSVAVYLAAMAITVTRNQTLLLNTIT